MTTTERERLQDKREELRRKRYRFHRRRELRSLAVPCPALVTDTTFLAGTGSDDGFGNDEMSRRIAYRKARAAGVTPTGRHISQIADELGDPKAWCSSRADVKRICEERGYSCDDLKVKGRSPDSPDPWDKPYEVAEDIVKESVQKELAGERIGVQERLDLEESTRQRLSGRR